jgi:hypothetical protein
LLGLKRGFRAAMNKFLPLLLCLVLNIFTVARATKPTHMAIPNMKTAHNEPRGQEAEAKTLLNDAKTGEEAPSDGDDSTEPASSDEGEDVNDDGGNASGDEDTGAHDGGDDGDGSDEDGGDEGE